MTAPRYTDPACDCHPTCHQWMTTQTAQRQLERAAQTYEDAADTDREARTAYAKHVENQAAAA